MKSMTYLYLVFVLLGSTSAMRPIYEVPRNKIVNTFTEEFERSTIVDTNASNSEICEQQRVEWSSGGEDTQLFDPGSTFFFPGNVLEAVAFREGRFIPVQGERLPIVVSTNALLKTQSAINPSPSQLSEARSAISKILRSKPLGTGGAQTIIACKEIYSEDHLRLHLKGNFSAGFSNVKGMFNFDDRQIKTRFLLEISQVFYTIDCDYPGIAGFFSRRPITQIDKSPLYVKSVSYGRKIVIAIETNEYLHKKEKNIKAEFQTFLSSGSLSASAETESLIKNRSVFVQVIGGSAELPFQVLGVINQKDSLTAVLRRSANWTLDNPGFPLMYAVHHCADDEVYKVGNVGHYMANVCLPKEEFIISLKLEDLTNLCAVPKTTNRQFSPNPITFDFNIEYIIRGNKVFAKIDANWFENGGTFSEAALTKEEKILTVPDSLVLKRIMSTSTGTISGLKLVRGTPYDNVVPHDLTKKIKGKDMIQRLIVIADTPDNDDSWGGECGNKHMQLQRIFFYPIKVSVIKKATTKTTN